MKTSLTALNPNYVLNKVQRSSFEKNIDSNPYHIATLKTEDFDLIDYNNPESNDTLTKYLD